MRLIALALLTAAAAAAQGDRAAELERVVEAQRKLLWDWGGLTRYGSLNTETPPPAPGERRVVFFGDDVFDAWDDGDAEFFPGKPYFNRGIARQTTPRMLVRFRQDVVKLRPRVVVIQGGMNDIVGLPGGGTSGMIMENVESMTDLARANGIAVVLLSLLPVGDGPAPRTAYLPVGKVLDLNERIEEHAEHSRAAYVNLYRALVENRRFKRQWTRDGLLPNAAGYAVMAPLVEAAIAEALAAAE